MKLTKEREALKITVAALKKIAGYDLPDESAMVSVAEQAITAAEEALDTSLAQPEHSASHGEPVAKVVLTERLGLPCLQWLDLDKQFDFKGGELLYTTPYVATPRPQGFKENE